MKMLAHGFCKLLFNLIRQVQAFMLSVLLPYRPEKPTHFPNVILSLSWLPPRIKQQLVRHVERNCHQCGLGQPGLDL